MSNEEKKSGGLKGVLLILVIVLVVPVVALGGVYILNDNFKLESNKYLSKLPGPVGEYFESYSTEEETSNQVLSIADYLLNIDVSRAVDKMQLIRADDEAVYDEIVRSMLRINPNETEVILEEIRSLGLKSNVLLTTLEQIETEENLGHEEKANYIGGLNTAGAIDEVKKVLDENLDGHQILSKIFKFIDNEKVATYLENISIEDKEKILNEFPVEMVNDLKTIISNRKSKNDELMNTAQILISKDPEVLAEMLGNEDTYKLDELNVIFTDLGPIKAGEILAKVNDSEFVFNLINKIKDNQLLETGEDNLTEDILKSLKVYSEFDDNINELNNIFAKLDDQKISEIIKRYFRSAGSYRSYPLSNGEEIRISDEDIALAVLDRMPQKKVASVLSFLDNTLSSEIAKKFALPNMD